MNLSRIPAEHLSVSRAEIVHTPGVSGTRFETNDWIFPVLVGVILISAIVLVNTVQIRTLADRIDGQLRMANSDENRV